MGEPEGAKQQRNRVSERATCKTGSSAPGTRSASGFPQQQTGEKHQIKGALGRLMVIGQPLPAVSW